MFCETLTSVGVSWEPQPDCGIDALILQYAYSLDGRNHKKSLELAGGNGTRSGGGRSAWALLLQGGQPCCGAEDGHG